MNLKLRNHKILFAGTLIYFALAFVNINLSLLALVCMITPLYLVWHNKKKTWCQGYCPRASLFSHTGRTFLAQGKKTPSSFIHGNVKWIIMGYFAFNIVVIAVTTIRVATGHLPAMNYPRFLLFFPIRSGIFQVFTLSDSANWLTHMAYRFFSMMMSTTFIGIVFSLLYKPRTWCTVCPIATMSDLILKKK